MRFRPILASFLLTALPAVASAQADRPAYVRALAAGYKASFVCSNLFNGGLTPTQTDADDLQGTYPSLNPLLPLLKAEVDRARRIVSVRYDDAMPPRIAAWRPVLGCAQLPIGATADAIATLPTLAARAPDLDARAWPTGDRTGASPRNAALDAVVMHAFDRRTFGQGSETTAVLVVRDGRIVAERYRPGMDMHSTQRTWSVGKSIAAAVIGAGVRQGLIDLDAPASVPEWQRPGDPRARITTDQLLRMASGLHSDTAGNRTDALYFGGIGVADHAASLPIVALPGTAFRYANNDILLAVRGLQHRLGNGGKSLLFPYASLFWPIGMTRTVAETDASGHFVMSSQVWTSARDLARFGLLHLNDGVWNGARLLPVGWRDYVRRNGAAQPAAGDGYGAGWWTFANNSGLPADAIVAKGNRGQYVVVIPSRKLVIVRRGFDRTDMPFDLDAFTRDLLQAVN